MSGSSGWSSLGMSKSLRMTTRIEVEIKSRGSDSIAAVIEKQRP